MWVGCCSHPTESTHTLRSLSLSLSLSHLSITYADGPWLGCVCVCEDSVHGGSELFGESLGCVLQRILLSQFIDSLSLAAEDVW